MGVMLRAVVVGINKYKDPRVTQLKYASNDAQEIAHLLKHSKTFTAENVTLLQNEAATRKAVREGVTNTFTSRSSDNNTIALFYFAGHGIVDEQDKRILLGCYDVNATDPEGASIRLNDIYDLLLSTSAECVIAIIDACYSGHILVGNVDHHSAAERAMQAIELLRHKEGKTIAIFAASTSDQAARERPALGHGVFTYELLRGWGEGAAQEQDGIVSLGGLANFLTSDQARYGKQKPQISLRSSRRIALWAVEPSQKSPSPTITPQTSYPAPQLPPRTVPTPQPGPASMVYEPVKLPTTTRTQSTNIQERNRLITIFVVSVITVLLILGLIIFFIVHLFIH